MWAGMAAMADEMKRRSGGVVVGHCRERATTPPASARCTRRGEGLARLDSHLSLIPPRLPPSRPPASLPPSRTRLFRARSRRCRSHGRWPSRPSWSSVSRPSLPVRGRLLRLATRTGREASMPGPNPTSLLDTQRLIIPYARPPRSLHLHQRDWRVRCPDVRSASEGSSPPRRQSAPRLMCRTLLSSTFASLSWDNDWKPPRHMLDDWNIQMMERDRRLTGSKRGQRVRVLFARAGPGSRQAAGRRAAAPVALSPSPSTMPAKPAHALSLSLSPHHSVLTFDSLLDSLARRRTTRSRPTRLRPTQFGT